MPNDTSNQNRRAPVVVVMGHIDHGKTTILDWYRKTKVVDSESGGITQHIGAYEVLHEGKKITFIDTPGHEAFSKMRSRGAKVADIGILVVAADEGLKPQTKEALQILQENNVPFIVAINKIDKPEANPERTKQQLAEANVLVESYGGKIPSVEISAKSGQNMDGLLELIQLVAELENLQQDIQKPAEGVVIEAHRDPRRGITTTLLVRDGVLKQGDVIVIGKELTSVKIFENFMGKLIDAAPPSSPIRVIGFPIVPNVGDFFRSFEDKKSAEKFIESIPSQINEKRAVETSEKPVFNIILKTDVGGSQEVLEESLLKFENADIGIRLLKSEVGDINESDVKLATATKLVTIIGFKVKVDPSVRELAENASIRIITGSIIYELLDEVKQHLIDLIPPVINRVHIGKVKILKIFKKEGSKQIIGGRVEDGIIKKDARVDIVHFKEVMGSGKVAQLQREKTIVTDVVKGFECGLLVESKITIEEGDLLEAFEEEIIKKTL